MYLIGRYKDGAFVDYARTGTDTRNIRVYETLDQAKRGKTALGKRWNNKGYELRIMKIMDVREEGKYEES